MSIKQAKGYKKRCDDLYSLIIRSTGTCLRCGYTCPCPNAPNAHTLGCKLTCSHIVGRRYSATRTLEANGQNLCFSCHRYFTDWPKEFSRWITETIGIETYEQLKQAAETVTKISWEDEYARLKEVAACL